MINISCLISFWLGAVSMSVGGVDFILWFSASLWSFLKSRLLVNCSKLHEMGWETRDRQIPHLSDLTVIG